MSRLILMKFFTIVRFFIALLIPHWKEFISFFTDDYKILFILYLISSINLLINKNFSLFSR